MIPVQDDHLLPENNAAAAVNTYLDSGALQGLKTPVLLHTMDNPGYKFAFRIPILSPDKNHIYSSYWLEFPEPDTNVLRSPVANDSFERFYFASPADVPQYNTKARIIAGDPPFTLGIPTPASAPTGIVTGGGGTTEARAYVYTWVSAYGEEGPPSEALSLTGFINGSWDLTLTAPTGADTTNRNLTEVRIYRTITNTSGSATFFLVDTLPIATTTYSDTMSAVTLSGNSLLESADWGGPPSDMAGFVSMPNGMMVGWRGNEVWFCEPFKPHAWPSAYTVSVDADIVGLGVVGQTLVVLTDSFPYAATGVSPVNMAFSKIGTFEPCLSRGSIISTAQGVFYSSANGVVLAAGSVAQNATLQLATRDRWQDLVRPETLRAARLSASYYAWGSLGAGCFEATGFEPESFEQYDFTGSYSGALINLIDPRVAWVQLEDEEVTDNVITDIWSGEIFLIRNGELLWLDMSSTQVPQSYIWRTKKFQMASIHNLSVMRVFFEEDTHDPSFVLNPVRNTATTQTLADDQYGLVRVYANDVLVMTRELRSSGEILRLPTGFKKPFWQFEIEARVKVFNFEAATSIKELTGV